MHVLPLGKRPRGVRVSPDAAMLYVALSGSPFAPPGVEEKTLPPPDRSADGIGVVDVRTLRLVRVPSTDTRADAKKIYRQRAFSAMSPPNRAAKPDPSGRRLGTPGWFAASWHSVLPRAQPA